MYYESRRRLFNDERPSRVSIVKKVKLDGKNDSYEGRYVLSSIIIDKF